MIKRKKYCELYIGEDVQIKLERYRKEVYTYYWLAGVNKVYLENQKQAAEFANS